MTIRDISHIVYPIRIDSFAPLTVILNKLVTFAKRRFGIEDTLISQLLSFIDGRESRLGSVYIFTY